MTRQCLDPQHRRTEPGRWSCCALRLTGRCPRAARSTISCKLNDHLWRAGHFRVSTSAGRVVASSDWIFSHNLLGADLSALFRCFAPPSQARWAMLRGRRAREPGYFALPIRDEAQEWKVIGVAAVKSSPYELSGAGLARMPALIVDASGVVLLARRPNGATPRCSRKAPPELARISREQFAGQPVGVTR